MTSPVAPGGGSFPFSPPQNWRDTKDAPITPDKRVPVVDKTKVDPITLKAAQGMEAMFLDYMMKTMRDTVPKSEMDLENAATGVYRSMMDTEVAQKAAKAGGIGLADQIIAYLEAQRYTLPSRGQVAYQGGPAQPAPRKELVNDPTVVKDRHTGGTHEGQPIRK